MNGINEIIKIEEKEGVRTCNARDLHEFLEVGRDFSNWMKQRIEKYHFVAGQDFMIIAHSGDNTQAGRPSKEYHISTDMAKELSMVENSEKGREARKYFIACEKALKAQIIAPPVIPATYGEALMEAGRLAIENDRLAIENEKMKPAVQFHEDVTGSNSAITMGEASKIINCGMGRNTIFAYLRGKKILQRGNVPYQMYVDSGWFRAVEVPYTNKVTGEVEIGIKTLVYQKGIEGIIRNLRKDGLM